jgi:hypothetical protein
MCCQLDSLITFFMAVKHKKRCAGFVLQITRGSIENGLHFLIYDENPGGCLDDDGGDDGRFTASTLRPNQTIIIII